MKKSITQLGPKEAEFIARLASKNSMFINVEGAVTFWKSKKLAYDVLQRLERKGWLERIEPGKYLIIPLEAGIERQWTEDPYLIASAIVQPSAIAYWSAIRHWNWTEQMPRIIYVQTTSRKYRKQQTIIGINYEFVTVNPRKFYGHIKEWRGSKQVLVTDKEKTLIDCADDVERAGTIEELAKAVRSSASQISWKKLDEYVSKFPNRAVMKRLGYLFETLVIDLSQEARRTLASWHSSLSEGIVSLQPSKSISGAISTYWRVRVNVRLG